MEIREMIKIVEHFAKGGKVESKRVGGEWRIDEDPTWDFEHIEYRIKEEPKVIPWTFENVPIHAVKVRDKNGNLSVLRVSTDFTGSPCFTDSKNKGFISFKEAAEKYVQLDCSPCGMVETSVKITRRCKDCKYLSLGDTERPCNECFNLNAHPNFEPK